MINWIVRNRTVLSFICVYQQYVFTNHIFDIYIYIYKQGLLLNNKQCLICHKTKPNQKCFNTKCQCHNWSYLKKRILARWSYHYYLLNFTCTISWGISVAPYINLQNIVPESSHKLMISKRNIFRVDLKPYFRKPTIHFLNISLYYHTSGYFDRVLMWHGVRTTTTTTSRC